MGLYAWTSNRPENIKLQAEDMEMTFVFNDEKCGECDVRKQTIKVGKSTNDEAIYGYLLMTIFEWLSPLMRTKIP